MGSALQIELTEGETPQYTATLRDEAGIVVPAASLSAARMTLYSVHTNAIVNGRTNQNVLNANDVTIGAAGEIKWKLREADTLLIDVPKPPRGHYRAVIVFEWSDAQGVPRQLVWVLTIYINQALNAPFA
jgi:hypothetical protein